MCKKINLFFFFLFLAQVSFGQDFYAQLSSAAIELTGDHVVYNPAYVRIPYPNGDVPSAQGVCTDVIIRAYRKLGVDLQKEVHEDMKANFSLYPSKKLFGLSKTDTNIDHRRVPNLQKFFSRKGEIKTMSRIPSDYIPGDIVIWDLPGNLKHIGLVVNKRSKDQQRHLVVHNIGRGQVAEDCLFSWKITGHYRYSK